MNIQLKNVKIAQFASEETTCFEATVYIDGVKAFTASDDGRGGCIDFHPVSKTGSALLTKAMEYAKGLPPIKTEFGEFPSDLEWVVNRLLEKYQNDKRFKRLCKTKTLFQTADCKEGEYMTINRPNSPEVTAYIMNKYPDAKIYIPEG